jgi:hypothetical protein
LVYAAKVDHPPSFAEWVDRARRIPAGQAHSHNLSDIASELMTVGLVRDEQGVIRVTGLPSCDIANRSAKVRMAKTLLQRRRPSWLPLSGDVQRIVPNLVPREDLVALQWLGDDLNHILASLLVPPAQDDTAVKLGWLGEHIVADAERGAGRHVDHVSEISASYGYDLTSVSLSDGSVTKIEVKTAVENGAGRFYLSRNEYEQSRRYPDEWMLLQVVLDSRIIWTQETLEPSVVIAIRSLPNEVLRRETVIDREWCAWKESVAFNLPLEGWREYRLSLPADWRLANPLFPRKNLSRLSLRA